MPYLYLNFENGTEACFSECGLKLTNFPVCQAFHVFHQNIFREILFVALSSGFESIETIPPFFFFYANNKFSGFPAGTTG
jgi:hypothetical protein